MDQVGAGNGRQLELGAIRVTLESAEGSGGHVHVSVPHLSKLFCFISPPGEQKLDVLPGPNQIMAARVLSLSKLASLFSSLACKAPALCDPVPVAGDAPCRMGKETIFL